MHHITEHLLNIEYPRSHHFSNGELIKNSIEVNVTRLEREDDSLQLLLHFSRALVSPSALLCFALYKWKTTPFVLVTGSVGDFYSAVVMKRGMPWRSPYLFNMDETIGNHSTHSTFTPRPELVNGMITSLLLMNRIDLPWTSTAKWYSPSSTQHTIDTIYTCFWVLGKKSYTVMLSSSKLIQSWVVRIWWRDHNVQRMIVISSAHFIPGSLFRERSHCDFRKFTGWGWHRTYYGEQMKCVFHRGMKWSWNYIGWELSILTDIGDGDGVSRRFCPLPLPDEPAKRKRFFRWIRPFCGRSSTL